MIDPKLPVLDTPKLEKNDNASGDDAPAPKEIGGRKGPDPTRYGDWEIGGKCVDF